MNNFPGSAVRVNGWHWQVTSPPRNWSGAVGVETVAVPPTTWTDTPAARHSKVHRLGPTSS
eukprot:2635003-Rhodomonas_salina.6